MANRKTQKKRENKRPSTKILKEELGRIYGYKCMLCDSRESIQCHHIVKFADGGATDLENTALLCANCHVKVHRNRSNEDYYNAIIVTKKKEKRI